MPSRACFELQPIHDGTGMEFVCPFEAESA